MSPWKGCSMENGPNMASWKGQCQNITTMQREVRIKHTGLHHHAGACIREPSRTLLCRVALTSLVFFSTPLWVSYLQEKCRNSWVELHVPPCPWTSSLFPQTSDWRAAGMGVWMAEQRPESLWLPVGYQQLTSQLNKYPTCNFSLYFLKTHKRSLWPHLKAVKSHVALSLSCESELLLSDLEFWKHSSFLGSSLLHHHSDFAAVVRPMRRQALPQWSPWMEMWTKWLLSACQFVTSWRLDELWSLYISTGCLAQPLVWKGDRPGQGGGLGPRHRRLELECVLPWIHGAADLQNYFKERKCRPSPLSWCSF